MVRRQLRKAVLRWWRGLLAGTTLFADLAAPDGKGQAPACDPACPHTCEAPRNAAARELLEKVRQRLSDRQFEVLHLHFVEGLFQAEIGARLGVSRGRVSQVLEEALREVREYFPHERGAW